MAIKRPNDLFSSLLIMVIKRPNDLFSSLLMAIKRPNEPSFFIINDYQTPK